MQHRIVKNGVGDYSIQIKRTWWPFWTFYVVGRDYNGCPCAISVKTKEEALSLYNKCEKEKLDRKLKGTWKEVYSTKSIDFVKKLHK